MSKKFLATLLSMFMLLGITVLPVSAEAAVAPPSDVAIAPQQSGVLVLTINYSGDMTDKEFRVYLQDGSDWTQLTEDGNTFDTLTKPGGGTAKGQHWAQYGVYAYKHTGLTNGNTYTYKITVYDSAQEKESEGFIASGTPTAQNNSYEGSISAANLTVNDYWKFGYLNRAYGTARVLQNVGEGGSAGIKLTRLGYSTDNASFMRVKYTPGFTTVSGKLYKLTWKQILSTAQASTVSGYWSHGFINVKGGTTSVPEAANTAWSNIYSSASSVVKESWTTQELYYYGDGNKFVFDVQPRQFFKYLIWDNFRLVEVDANGDEVDGINLLADYDCDFEDAFSPAAKPADAYVSSLDGKNIVVVEASDSTDFHIYSKASDGQLTLLSLTALTDGSGGGGDWSAKNLYAFEHSGLTNGTKYTYVVKAVNEYGESEGIEISGTPKQGVGSYTNEVLNSFWTFQNNGKSYSTVTAKRGIGYNGTAGLRITRLGKITGNYSTTDLFYTSDYTTVEDQLYKLTYKQKISNGPVAGWYDSYGFIQTNGSLDGENFPTGITPTRTYNSSVDRADVWAEKTLYFRGNGNRFAFNARITQCVKYLIWDDFRLVTVDGELNETSGTNLLADSDCGFEDAFVQQITAEFGFYPADGDEFDYGARLDDEKINAFSAALEDYGTSTIRGEAEVKNIGYTEGVPAVLILAVYKDSYLYDVYSLTSNVPAIESAAEEGEILALAYTLPELLDDGVYSAKLMLLDGFGSLKPLVAGPAPEIGE